MNGDNSNLSWDALSEPVCKISGDGEILECNRAFEITFGQKTDIRVGSNFFESILKKAAKNDFRRLLLASFDVPYVKTESISLPAFERRWFRWQIVPSSDGYIASGFDVTDLVIKELARKERERQYKVVVETQPQHICQFLPSGKIIFSNPRFFDFIHTICPDVSDFLGVSFFDLLPEKNRSYYREQLSQSALEKTSWDADCAYRTESLVADIEWSFTPLCDDHGELLFFLGVGSDITDRKKAQALLKIAKEEAEKASRAKSAFLSKMGHEIRTPMNSILGFSNLLRPAIDNPTLLSYLDSLETSGQELLAFINDVLDYSEAEAGNLALVPDEVDLRSLLREVADIYRYKFEEKRLGFECEFDENLPQKISIDASRLRQSIALGLGNALKFSEEGTTILAARAVVLSEDSDQVDLHIEIRDSGIGIGTEELDQIFEAFSQVEDASTRSQEGTGLGLALAKKLVDLMGGTIDLESRIGVGTKLTIHLRGIPVVATTAAEADDLGIDQFEPKTFVIADDSSLNRLLLKSLFDGSKHACHVAVDGEEALQLIIDKTPDIVLSDVYMPGLSGLELAKIVKNDPMLANIHFVFISSASFEEEIGPLSFDCLSIVKPVTAASLVGVLKELLRDEGECELERVSTKSDLSGSSEISEKVTNRVEWKKLISRLPHSNESEWQQFCLTMELQNLETFASNLIEESERLGFPDASEIGRSLLQSIQNMDLGNIEGRLDELTQIRNAVI